MKRILIALLLVSPLSLLAQRKLFDREINLPDHNDKLIHFGINVGINRSHFNFLQNTAFLSEDSIMVVESLNNSGLQLAWLVNMRLSEHFSLRTFPLDLVFTEKAFQYSLKYPDVPGGESELMTKKLQGITMMLPIQVKFQSDRIDNFRVYMLAGVKGELDLAANKGKTNADRLFKTNKFDYGLEGGIGFHIYFPVFVLTPELKMGWGLTNVHDRDPNYKFSRVLDKINARTITLSLTVE